MWRGVSDGRLRGLVVSGMVWLIGLGWLLCSSRLSCTLLYSNSPSSTSERQEMVQQPPVSRPSGGTHAEHPGRGTRRSRCWQRQRHRLSVWRTSQSRQVETGVRVARQRPPPPLSGSM